ncbi:hypothetical protein H9P43_002589 [Blastocladiella emersonii ATCC 22665]|nr:hypothetical protein H9P43_002589 [Blastocladiella emersonii ATCC 22665]
MDVSYQFLNVVPPKSLQPRFQRELDRYPCLTLDSLNIIITTLHVRGAPLVWNALPCHLVSSQSMDLLWSRHDPTQPILGLAVTETVVEIAAPTAVVSEPQTIKCTVPR